MEKEQECLKAIKSLYLEVHISIANDITRKVLDALKEAKAHKEWIKTSEKKPELGERVLCSTIFGIQIGWRKMNGDWELANGARFTKLEHWMPLPNLPK